MGWTERAEGQKWLPATRFTAIGLTTGFVSIVAAWGNPFVRTEQYGREEQKRGSNGMTNGSTSMQCLAIPADAMAGHDVVMLLGSRRCAWRSVPMWWWSTPLGPFFSSAMADPNPGR